MAIWSALVTTIITVMVIIRFGEIAGSVKKFFPLFVIIGLAGLHFSQEQVY